MPKAWPLCTGAKMNLRERVSGEVAKKSSIALPVKGGHKRAPALKAVCPNLGGFGEDFPGGSDGKASVYNAGDLGSSPGLRRSPGEGNGNPLSYCCLENPMDRGAWYATVYGVAKSRTRLIHFTSLHFTL